MAVALSASGNVVEIKALPTGADATPVVRAAVAQLRDGDSLVFEKGEYHFYPDMAESVEQGISNNRYGVPRKVVLNLKDRQGVTIDGGGSTFVCHGDVMPFLNRRCLELAFRAFTVTADIPAAIGFQVTKKDERGFELAFDTNAAPVKVAPDGLVFCTTWGERTNPIAAIISLDTHRIVYLAHPVSSAEARAGLAVGHILARPTQIDARHIRFDDVPSDDPRRVRCDFAIGERLCFNLTDRSRVMFLAEDCDKVTVEDVTVRRFVGMGVVAQRSKNLTLRRYRVAPNAGELVTTGADAMMFTNCGGEILVEDCEVSRSLDDVFNNHGNYAEVASCAGNRLALRIGHPEQRGFLPFRVGDDVEFIAPRSRAALARAKVTAAYLATGDAFELEVEPAVRVAAKTLVENVTLVPNVTIRRCRFSDYPNLRVSQRGRLVVEDNVMRRGCTALMVNDLADYWYESGRVSDLVFRNNVVDDCNFYSCPIQVGVSGWATGDPNAPKVHGRIRLEGNEFRNLTGERMRISGVWGFWYNTRHESRYSTGDQPD